MVVAAEKRSASGMGLMSLSGMAASRARPRRQSPQPASLRPAVAAGTWPPAGGASARRESGRRRVGSECGSESAPGFTCPRRGVGHWQADPPPSPAGWAGFACEAGDVHWHGLGRNLVLRPSFGGP